MCRTVQIRLPFPLSPPTRRLPPRAIGVAADCKRHAPHVQQRAVECGAQYQQLLSQDALTSAELEHTHRVAPLSEGLRVTMNEDIVRLVVMGWQLAGIGSRGM